MSRHNKERDEKICLNCNAATYGRFCHVCGQENIETTESFWHLLQHFVFDLFHFDGKFWVSLKYLLFKPGFLAKEYIRGRRASYLHPIRMYIFINTVFFIIFFSFYNKAKSPIEIKEKPITTAKKLKQLEQYKTALQRKIADSNFILKKQEFIAYIPLIEADIKAIQKDSSKRLLPLESDGIDTSSFYVNDKPVKNYSSLAQYDSFQTTLTKSNRDGFIKRYIAKERIAYKNAVKEGKSKEFWDKWVDAILHSIPKLLFVSMPFLALILMILYVRNKKYFYVHHIVFTLYFYCGIFILTLFNFWSGSISKWLGHGKSDSLLNSLFTLAFLYFMYKSFKNFYEQGRVKTILKLISVGVFILLFVIILFLIAALLIQLNF